MPDQWYNSGLDALNGARSWTADNYNAVLIDNQYTFSSSHSNLSDVPSGARISTVALSSKTISSGVLSAASPITWSNVTSTNPLIGFVICYDSGSAATSTLIAYYDGAITVTIAATATGTAISVDPLLGAVPNSAVMTRLTGTGAASITLSGSGGGAANARTLTANSSVSVVAGDTYSVGYTNSGFPISSNPNGGSVIHTISGSNGLARLRRL